MKPIYLFLAFSFCSIISFGQSSIGELCQKVLKQNKTDSSFLFDNSNKENGIIKVRITYLGTVETKRKQLYKILTYKLTWGSNAHTDGTIYIYNLSNKYVGKYSLGDALDLPSKLKDETLIFSNENKDSCDKKIFTSVNFRNGIPKLIFIKCKEKYGDIYYFSK